MEYSVIQNDKYGKVVLVNFNGASKSISCRIKRSFTVLLNLLDHYPNWMDIHSLDSQLGDPNRAMTDLRNDDGFEHFIQQRRNSKRNNEYLLNLTKLFEQHKNQKEISLSVSIRLSPSNNLKRTLREKFNNKCNITGIKLMDSLPKKSFLKILQIIQYDHRVPLFKGGDNNPDSPKNWQLLSELVNREKNKLCGICQHESCINCALAFPEESKIIKANGQNISAIMNLMK